VIQLDKVVAMIDPDPVLVETTDIEFKFTTNE
jgi:hypothetical protein